MDEGYQSEYFRYIINLLQWTVPLLETDYLRLLTIGLKGYEQMKWYIETDRYAKVFRKNAGSKAPADIAEIYREMGMKAFIFPAFPREARSEVYKKLWLLVMSMLSWFKVLCRVNKGDIIFFRHPFYGNRFTYGFLPFLQKWKKCKFVVLIHDLGSLRKDGDNYADGTSSSSQFADNYLLKRFDAVICHNRRMKKYLISEGLSADKIVCLEMFDYLTRANTEYRKKSDIPSIAIAGSLDLIKSGYIYRMNYPKEVLTVHLYGRGFDTSLAAVNLIYHGSFEPEELPRYLTGDFGLVWDGVSTETCAGSTGEYLRYNNPHKLSLYLASGMPVIVWEDAAVAEFVLSKNLGVTVKSLAEIPERIKALSPSEYQDMCAAARKEGEKLRNGYYTKKAIEQALQVI